MNQQFVEETRSAPLQTVTRALRLLRCFLGGRNLLSLTDIARELRLPKPMVHRLLTTLEAEEFVQRDPETRRYRPGLTLLELGAAAADALDVRSAALPVIRELVDQSGETVFLTVREGDEAICIELVDSPHAVKVSYRVGFRHPLHAGAPGKVLLAYLPPDERRALLSRLPLRRYTERTPTDPEVIEQQLAEIRAAGIAVSESELQLGAWGAAVPIWGHRGELLAGLGLVAPVGRVPQERVPALLDLLRTAGARISVAMGFRSRA